jgi:hypothetical protein
VGGQTRWGLEITIFAWYRQRISGSLRYSNNYSDTPEESSRCFKR